MSQTAVETSTKTSEVMLPDVGISTLFRCDRCAAQAFVVASKDELLLLFCGHHGRRYEPILVGQGWNLDDRTHLINKQASPSASNDD